VSTVMVCDDSPLARDAMRRSVAHVPGVRRVVTANSGEEALLRWEVDRPELVLMDVRMPGLGGLEATRRLLARHPEARILITTMAEDPEGVARAVAAGARGYVVKDISREELVTAIAHTLDDQALRPSARTPQLAPGEQVVALSERELQVLTGMSRGRSNAEIGRELYLSEDTVKTHARRLFRKLGAADRAHAVTLGFRRGLLR
jgi:DNA-binding NarL/FixJ family response regulator